MGDVVPDDVIRVGIEGRLNVVGVLGCEMPFDDVHDSTPFVDTDFPVVSAARA